ncbi:hypothetical protein [Agrobacterium cavarae]|uniref:hypothetical protein n=1 Tax=Agrobacterium cavarae TaxID=2528239 RepID=UPI003FCEFDF7
MTKKALVSQADLKRMAAIAKSEGVVVSVEIDGKKYSVSPVPHLVTSDADISNDLDEWRARNEARGVSTLETTAVSTANGKRRKAIDVDKTINDWNAYLGYDPETMNEDDYRRLFAEKEVERKKQIPASPMTKLEISALKQILTHGAGVPVKTHLIKPCGPNTEERLEARGFIRYVMKKKFPDRIDSYILTAAGEAAALQISLEAPH